MADENYAIAAATRLQDIGFADFTSDLVRQTLQALIEVNFQQNEMYFGLVKEVTKSLSAYINDTKLEISNQEVLDHLGSLPKFIDDQGQSILNQAGATSAPPTTPVALVPDEQVKPIDLTAINKNFTSGALASTILQAAGLPAVTSLVKDSLGLVRSLFPAGNTAVFPLQNNDQYYDPSAFKLFLSNSTNSAVAAAPVTLHDASIAKLYDSVAEVIAGDKYALLQEMMKLGVVRIVTDRVEIATALTFSTWERSSKSNSSYEKHSDHMKAKSVSVQQQPSSRGIFKSLRNRPLQKARQTEREVHVQTVSEQSAASQGTTISIFGGVKLYLHTDYMPVAQA
jgi:hypothetical protein